ncbi:hypothetical protein KW791_00465 [Candidatus Parcubacteria bacterium]|nr:hypothetical protein [Candidatus Parcubacteria bacterium]
MKCEETNVTVKQTILNPEQIAANRAQDATSEKEFASRLAQSMDLPSTLTEEIDQEEKNRQSPPKVEEPEEQVEESEEPETEDVAEEPESETEESVEEEEDLIPRSKVQKRFDEQTAQIKDLERRLQKETQAREAATPKTDPQQDALEKMSESELKTLKRQIRVEQINLGADKANRAQLDQLLDLEEKIDRTIQTAPARFQNTQISRFNQAVQATAESFENFESVKTQIFQQAKAIYESSPELQGSVAGQERAWKFAVDHFTAVQKASEGKSDTTELKRQVNTLKKKISVDTTSKKGIQQPDNDAKLKRRAINGTEADKTNFLKTRINVNELVPDSELRSLENMRR